MLDTRKQRYRLIKVSIPVRFTLIVRALETAVPERGNRRDGCTFALLSVIINQAKVRRFPIAGILVLISPDLWFHMTRIFNKRNLRRTYVEFKR